MSVLSVTHGQGNPVFLVTKENVIGHHADRIIYLRDGRIERDDPIIH